MNAPTDHLIGLRVGYSLDEDNNSFGYGVIGANYNQYGGLCFQVIDANGCPSVFPFMDVRFQPEMFKCLTTDQIVV